jgi:ribose transport system permease protein
VEKRVRVTAQGMTAILRSRELGTGVVLIVLCLLIVASEARSAFLDPTNLQNLSRQIALLGIFAVGEAVVIIVGGIDLSVGSVIGFTGMLCARLFAERGWPWPAAILVTLVVSVAIGALHAALTHPLRIPPFVVTLGSLSVLRSVAQLMNNALPIPIAGEHLNYRTLDALGNGQLLGIPIPVWLLVLIAGPLEAMMRRSAMGRYLYAVGSNEEATRLSGVPVFHVKIVAYGLCSLLAGVTGILYMGYNGQGDPRSGTGYELNAIAAAVIGGCSLAGGQGSLLGAVLGAGILHVILNGINLIIRRNASLWEGTIVGGVVVLAVLLNVLARRRER